MEDKTYNGWSSRETWLVNLHFNPQSLSDLAMIKEMIEDIEENIKNMFLRDYVNFSLIDWWGLEQKILPCRLY